MLRISLLCTPEIMPEMTSTEGLGVEKHPTDCSQNRPVLQLKSNGWILLGVCPLKVLRCNSLTPWLAGQFGKKSVLYAGATDCTRIGRAGSAKIVLAPGAAQGRFWRLQEWWNRGESV